MFNKKNVINVHFAMLISVLEGGVDSKKICSFYY